MKHILFTAFGLLLCLIAYSQKTFNLPSEENPIMSITVPLDEWEADLDDNLFFFKPRLEGDLNRLFISIWSPEDPSSDDAFDKTIDESFQFVELILTEVYWAEDLAEFDINGIAIYAIDGAGYFQNDDGTSDEMSCSIMVLIINETYAMSLIFISTPESYNKWEEKVLEVLFSMQPLK